LTLNFQPNNDLGSNQNLNRNVYQEYFLGVKSAGVYDWQPYHFHVTIFLKSGNLNILKYSEDVQDCNGTDLTLPYTRTEIQK